MVSEETVCRLIHVTRVWTGSGEVVLGFCGEVPVEAAVGVVHVTSVDAAMVGEVGAVGEAGAI